MIIDFRIRPPFKGFLSMVMFANPDRRDRFTRQLGFEPAPSASQQSVPMLLEEMDAAGVGMGVVVGRNAGMLGSVSNDDVAEFVSQHPGRFVAVASIDPSNRKAAVAEIDRRMAAGFKAINIEPGAWREPMHTDDRRLYPIYAHCEDRGIPLIMMTGGQAGPDISYTSPERIDRVLADFPTLKIVSSHGNWPWVTEILHVAFRRPNLYLSPDMYLANLPGMNDYVQAADGFLADRFLYASSYPFCGVKLYADWFGKLPIRPENREKVMYRNAAALLGL
jgi:predicted TIM-barrel fold metal-dependent hydrolase